MRPVTLLRHVCLALLCAAPAAAQVTVPAECQPVVAAGDKQFTLPSHAFIASQGLGPTPMQSEVINIGGVTYVKGRDHWMKSPQTSEQIALAAREKLKGYKVYTCKQLPDEAVGAVAASVYTAHTDSGTGTTDTQIWVAKATGLPLKSEVDIGSSSGHTSHMSVRYEYENVKAPAGIQ